MSYVIHIKKPNGDVAWHTGHRETPKEIEAQAFATEKQAGQHLALCGLYRWLEWKTSVKKSKTPVNVPGPGSNFTYESTVMPARMQAAAPKPAKKPKQLSMFDEEGKLPCG